MFLSKNYLKKQFFLICITEFNTYTLNFINYIYGEKNETE